MCDGNDADGDDDDGDDDEGFEIASLEPQSCPQAIRPSIIPSTRLIYDLLVGIVVPEERERQQNLG